MRRTSSPGWPASRGARAQSGCGAYRWGGFNAIQVALRRPPALKAIIAVDASDDLFHDDVHYIDGLLHLDEYAVMIDQLNALPPAPDFPLDEETLARRFDSLPWLVTWLAQQQDGPYWQRGSLRPDYGRLTIPAFLIGGWYDGYRDSVPRMFAQVPAPVKMLIGPWNHTFPHNAVPGPAIEWRDDAIRWWDHWLKGAENGIMSEPPVTVYVRDWYPPDLRLTEIPGRWRTEAAFPPERTAYQVWHCGPEHNLLPDAPPDRLGRAALRAVGRCRGWPLVGRAHPGPARRGRLQPGLRHPAAGGRRGDPRLPGGGDQRPHGRGSDALVRPAV